jgi:glycosyltransferase involved in cell wall biosynthesis
MNLKNIVIFMPSIESGGADKNLFIISSFLSKKFKNVSVVTSSNINKKKFNNKVKLITPGLLFWDKFGRIIKSIISILILIKVFLKKKDILVLSFQSNILAIIICKIFSKKIITRSNSFPNHWTNSSIKKYLFKKIYPLADHSIVNSLRTQKDFIKNYKIKPVCIYNPLNKKKIIQFSKKSVPKIFKKNKLKIINVGRLSKEKDHYTFLKALYLLKNEINFDAVIMGQGKLKNEILSLIKEYNLQKNVRLIGYKSNPYPYIKQSDFLVLTSLHEGLPNILLEAIVLKKFIISSDCISGPKEILLNGKGGALFKTQNFKDLKNQIIFYKKNTSKVNQKVKFALKNIVRFDYKKNLDIYSNILKKFINQ